MSVAVVNFLKDAHEQVLSLVTLSFAFILTLVSKLSRCFKCSGINETFGANSTFGHTRCQKAQGFASHNIFKGLVERCELQGIDACVRFQIQGDVLLSVVLIEPDLAPVLTQFNNLVVE